MIVDRGTTVYSLRTRWSLFNSNFLNVRACYVVTKSVRDETI